MNAPDASSGPSAFPRGCSADAGGRVGVLLLNLGTPDAWGYWPMRRYLREFLSDQRVIEEPRWKWWPILNLVILTVRPGPKGKDYAKIWNMARDESPIKTITRSQAEKLAALLADRDIVVDWAMRYANPSTASRLTYLQQQGCDRILLVPLYPQYAAASTASACDQAFRALMRMRWQPSVRIAPPYFENPTYIEAVATSIREHLTTLDFEPEALIISFHGMPQRYFDKGDPYRHHCERTAQLVQARLGWPSEHWHLAFQSRFGSEPWLQPYTIEEVARLAKGGVTRLAIVAPGFSADCLETLEELNIENRRVFLASGGRSFTYVPCLNDSALGMHVIENVVRRELAGWI
jgi:ferrochelatase